LPCQIDALLAEVEYVAPGVVSVPSLAKVIQVAATAPLSEGWSLHGVAATLLARTNGKLFSDEVGCEIPEHICAMLRGHFAQGISLPEFFESLDDDQAGALEADEFKFSFRKLFPGALAVLDIATRRCARSRQRKVGTHSSVR
jgi:hypothetical protein